MEQRFEVFVDDVYAIIRLKEQKEKIEYNLKQTSYFEFKRRKMLEKVLERYSTNLENHYNNLLRKINKLTFKEFMRIVMHTTDVSVKAYRYDVDDNDFYEMLVIKDKMEDKTVYCGYNKHYFYRAIVTGLIDNDIPELLAKNSINPMKLSQIDKYDVIMKINNYDEVMQRFYKSYIKFLLDMFVSET